MSKRQKGKILILNSDQWTPLDMQPFNDVIGNLVNEKYLIKAAVVGEYVQGPIRTDGSRFQIPWPIAVYVNRYVHQDFSKIAPMDPILATRMAILHRDLFTCQYCNGPAATWDHVFPKSRGGENTWLNLVAACSVCNGFKANRTPEEAEVDLQKRLSNPSLTDAERATLPVTMKLQRAPFVPEHDPYRRAQKDVWEMLSDGSAVDLGE